MWEIGRRTYYWSAAKIFRWGDAEKFVRETAWIDRAAARDERVAKNDARAANNSPRKWLGVNFATFAFAAVAFQLNVPWWQSALTVVIAAG